MSKKRQRKVVCLNFKRLDVIYTISVKPAPTCARVNYSPTQTDKKDLLLV